MMGRTHAIFAAAAAVPVALMSGQAGVLGVGLIAGLVPDLDASEGMLKHWYFSVGSGKDQIKIKPFYPIAEVVSLLFKHRGFLHSLYAALLLGVILLIFTPWYIALAGFVGYVSHLALDACTPAGVPLLMLGKWHLLPKPLRIRTNSYVEHLILAIAGVLIIAYVLPLMAAIVNP